MSHFQPKLSKFSSIRVKLNPQTYTKVSQCEDLHRSLERLNIASTIKSHPNNKAQPMDGNLEVKNSGAKDKRRGLEVNRIVKRQEKRISMTHIE